MTIQYDPQKVTDWLTPLEKVYARQSQQLDRYHEQLRERDRQEEAAVVDVPEMFSKLASFSKTIGSVVAARKAEKKEKTYNTWNQIERTDEDIKAEKEHFRLKKLDLDKDDIALKENLKRMSPELRDYLTNLSPAEIVWTKEFNAKKALNFITESKWKGELSATELEELKTLDETTYNNRYKNWIGTHLEPYKLSDGLFSSAVSSEIDRVLSTSKTTNSVKKKAGFANKAQLKFGERFTTALATGDGHDAVQLVSNRIQTLAGQNQTYMGKAGGLIELDETEIQKAANTVANDIKAAASVGEITEDQIEKLLNHEGLADHPAGKTLKKAFFNQATENALVQAARDGATVKLNKTRAEGKLKLTEVLNKGYANGFKSQAEFDAAALPYKSLVSSEDWKQAEKFNFVSQSETVYNREAEHLNNSVSNGTFLTKSNRDRVKNSENNKVVTEFGEKQNKLIQHQKDNLFADFETRNISNSNIVSQDSGKLTLADGEPLGVNTWPGKLSLEMTKWEDIIYQKHYNNNPDDPNIPIRVATDMKALKEEKGFGIPIGEKGAGEWSKDANGNYPNFVRSKVGEIVIIDNASTWERNLTTKWNNIQTVPGVPIVDTFLNTPGTILSPEEIINIVTSDDPQLSPKFIHNIGKIPNKPKGKALIQITEALINSDDPKIKELVKNSKLESKLKKLTTPDGENATPLQKLIKAEEFLTELVDKVADPDISQIHKKVEKVGFENLTPKEKVRYYNNLYIVADIKSDQDARAKLAKDAEIKKALDVQDRRKKAKEEADRKTAEQAEQLQEQIEGLWTP